MINEMLLKILVCPENRTPVTLADGATIEALNARIRSGALKNRKGEVVKEIVDGGLIRADRRYLYPVRNDIPVMLIDEAIELSA